VVSFELLGRVRSTWVDPNAPKPIGVAAPRGVWHGQAAGAPREANERNDPVFGLW
jgi:hypothetical protein